MKRDASVVLAAHAERNETSEVGVTSEVFVDVGTDAHTVGVVALIALTSSRAANTPIQFVYAMG